MSTFKFKQFSVSQAQSSMKVGTDAMVLGAFIDVDEKTTGLDIGSGTGVLSLMIAQRNNQITINAVEIDELAALESKLNFSRSIWNHRLIGIHQDIAQFDTDYRYDLIFSNPPYYQDSLHSMDSRKAQAKHGAYLPIESLITKVDQLISDDGHFWLIIPFDKSTRWLEECIKHNLLPNKRIQIYGKDGGAVKRIIYSFSRRKTELSLTSLTIRSTSGEYTQEYIELTKDYHDRDLSI